MTTGATLLVIMDLALLLWMLTVWKGLMLRDCLLSAIPLTWTLSSGDATEAGWGAALAVVPMLHKQLRTTWPWAQREEANALAHMQTRGMYGEAAPLEGVRDYLSGGQLKTFYFYLRQLCETTRPI